MKNRFCLSVLIVLSIFTFTLPVAEKVFAQASPQPLKIPEVVAKVNGVDIQSKYIEFRLNQILKNVKRPLTLRERTSVVKDLIEKEIVRELVHQQGKKKNLEIDSDLIEQEMAALRKPYDSDEEFEKALSARSITMDDLKNSMKVDINARQLLNEQIKGKITIADADVKKYYEDNKPKFNRPESYRTRHILAAIFPPDMLRSTPVAELQNKKESLTRKAEEKIDAIIKELKEGANFEELAKEKSDDEATRENGGDLDVIYKGIFDPSFDEAVSKLNPGETSGKVETRFGFHIIKLIEKRPSEQAPFEELEKAIQKHLFMEEAKKVVASYIDDLKKQATIKTFFE
ncbi:MAG: peptidylprolyl isomerase [Nitrospinae bacterium]|nr:peptidylprolyl isomerase [Nitrospinota bacterium]MBL7019752.1 peptidylprolyl isomerase [Nitrospinaceae bacterium]